MNEESDNIEYLEDEIDDKLHEKLVDSVLKLNKVQHVKGAHRTEPTTQISEFNLVKSLNSNPNLVHINELTKSLGGKSLQISNKVKSTSSASKTLPKPLDRPVAERIKRSLNYEKSKLQLDRWEALVTANRAAGQLKFPLGSDEKLKVIEKKAMKYPLSFRVKSEFEKKLEDIESKVEEYHIDTEEKKEEYPLTLEELKEKRKELAKLRAHQSFKEAKARRQNKIKSKKYHRILRREKIKQQLKEFEQLQKVNPEEALKKLEDIEKARAEERFSLRHKGTGQWARNKQVRAKYDKESRQELAKQLAISRELTQKVKSVNSDSEDDGLDAEVITEADDKSNENNPWVNGIKPTKDVADFVSGYRKYWNEVNKKNDEDNEEGSKNESVNKNEQSIKKKSGNKKLSASGDDKNKKLSQSDSIGIKSVEDKKKKKQILGIKELNDESESQKCVKQVKKAKTKENKKQKHTNLDSSLSTSEWEVSYVTNKSGKHQDIEDIFDSLEGKINQKINQKLKKIKKETTVKTTKKQKSKNSKKKKKFDLSLPAQKKKQILDEEMTEQTHDLDDDDDDDDVAEKNADPNMEALKRIMDSVSKPEEEPININPDKFMKVQQTHLHSAVADISTTDDNEEHISQRELVMEAFEDDDIAVDFEKEKAEEVEKDTPQDIDLNLPGWGSWAGGNINPNKRKRKRFIIKMPEKVPRKDDNKGSLIINEKAQAKVKPLLVSEVPFPFKSVKDYEASVRAPIGNTFVPETAFRKFIEPSVVTKMGTIIEPINKGILMGVRKV